MKGIWLSSILQISEIINKDQNDLVEIYVRNII